jgi:hypothetical protein
MSQFNLNSILSKKVTKSVALMPGVYTGTIVSANVTTEGRLLINLADESGARIAQVASFNLTSEKGLSLALDTVGNILDNETLSLRDALPLLANKQVKIKITQNEQYLNAQVYPLSAVVTVETVPAVEEFDIELE